MRKQISTLNESGYMEKRTYEIIADSRVLDALEKVITTMQYLGKVGASRILKVFVDGDGGGRFKIKRRGKIPLATIEVDTEQDEITLGID